MKTPPTSLSRRGQYIHILFFPKTAMPPPQITGRLKWHYYFGLVARVVLSISQIGLKIRFAAGFASPLLILLPIAWLCELVKAVTGQH